MSDRVQMVGMLLAAGLIALLILSAKSCSVDGHHQITKQVQACYAKGGVWHDTSDVEMSGYCEYPKP